MDCFVIPFEHDPIGNGFGDAQVRAADRLSA